MNSNVERAYLAILDGGKVRIDSRKVQLGDIFVALKGESHDGAIFVESAIDNGAKITISNRNIENESKNLYEPDPLQFLQSLAKHHRSQLKTVKVIAVVGSNGKTTTKELIGRVLGAKYNTYMTRGNYNNHIGLPLAVLDVNKTHEFAVLEMGANHLGEHSLLCDIAMPDFGIVTNCGKDHLEGYGTIENVIKSNVELYQYLRTRDGVVFVNVNDQTLLDNSETLTREFYGLEKDYLSKEGVVLGTIIETFPFMSIQIRRSTTYSDDRIIVNSHLFGQFQVYNLLCAASIGLYFEVDPFLIKNALEGYIPANNRSQLMYWNNNTILLDAYNANPSSMSAMVRDFGRSKYTSKMLVLGDMLELGQYSSVEHEEIIKEVGKYDFDKIIFVGNIFMSFKGSYNYIFFEKSSDVHEFLIKENISGYTILAKGSRGIAVEKSFGSLETQRKDLVSFNIPHYDLDDFLIWKTIPIVESGSSLVEISNISPRLIVKPMYFELGIPGALLNCFIREEIVEKLIKVLKRLPENLSILVYDGWRPLEVQQSLFDMQLDVLRGKNPDFDDEKLLVEAQKYVSLPSSNPYKPSPHYTGGSIDITLIDRETNVELDMGTIFDDFTEKANTRFFDNSKSIEELKIAENRRLLYHNMILEGFVNYKYEWWHFDYGNQWWAKQNNTVAIFGGIEP